MMTYATSDTGTPITVFTIGFTGHSAEEFFAKLKKAGVRTLVDVRLNNVSQLAGFAKKQDLRYFLQAIAGIAYVHEKSLAPTKDILDAYTSASRAGSPSFSARTGRSVIGAGA